MSRWCQIALGGVISCSVFGLFSLLSPSAASPVQPPIVAGPTKTAQVIAAAEASGLHWDSDPPGKGPRCTTLYISTTPLTDERREVLWMHTRSLETWRGVVRVGIGDCDGFFDNFDPNRHEHFALWGEMFLYGDPELIARLLASQLASKSG
jgi:hypothetical protein